MIKLGKFKSFPLCRLTFLKTKHLYLWPVIGINVVWISFSFTWQESTSMNSWIQIHDKKKPAKRVLEKWWPKPGSNRRHMDFQSIALPTELSGQCFYHFTRLGLVYQDKIRCFSIKRKDTHRWVSITFYWRTRRGSNPRSSPWQGDMLTATPLVHQQIIV